MPRFRLSPEERETHITMCDAYTRANVYSEQRPVITKVRALAKKYPDAVKIFREGKHGGTSSYIEADMPISFIGLRPGKFAADATNGHSSPIHDGDHKTQQEQEQEELDLFHAS